MKVPVSLNQYGKRRATEFLKKNDKYFGSVDYDLTEAIAEIGTKATDSDAWHYELNSFSSKTGFPVTIHFESSDFIFEEVE